MRLERVVRAVTRALPAVALIAAASASAQQPPAIPFTPLDPTGQNAAFPKQNPQGPTGAAYQVNYPYGEQCLANPANAALFPTLPACTTTNAPSFGCPTGGGTNRTAGSWGTCGTVVGYQMLNPILPASVPLVTVPPTPATPKFVWPVLNPFDYSPDTTTFPNADYYEIGVHEANGFQAVAGAGLFPNPTLNPVPGPAVPQGMQWTGLTCNVPTGCTCPSDISATFATSYCSAAGKIPVGAPLYTPIWGVGQINAAGGPATTVLGALGLFTPGTATAYSLNNYVATWPSISIRGTRGRPVVVKWVNEFPNNHVFCPHPEAADWPCAIDRTFMGVRDAIDPGRQSSPLIPAHGVNQYGGPQQPDNSWVTHLHGGEIPPGTDGFAEKWFGNAVTGPLYSPTPQFVFPPFENPSRLSLQRPAGNADLYTYPMVNDEATIWFHDHTLGKTHHNVIAGPAGFFPVKDPAKHGKVLNGVCQGAAGSCDYTWLDPVTEPRKGPLPLGATLPAGGTLPPVNVIPQYDMFFAIQDRSFNDDGSINFSNGLGQNQAIPPPVVGTVACTPALLAAGGCVAPGTSAITNGVNPLVHPTWVPEYFGDHVLVNGVLWPRMPTEPGWYRLRLVDGSDSRCWTIGFSTSLPAPGTRPLNNVAFYVIADDQGYLQKPVLAPGRTVTMCPGERYELLVNFGKIDGLPAGAAASVFMTNSAPAPFPAGITPFALGSPFAEMNVVMRFDVNAANGPGVPTCGAIGAPAALSWDPALPVATNMTTACMPANPTLQLDTSFVDIRPTITPPNTFSYATGTPFVVRQIYLNERLDGVTGFPMGMQLNGVPFEYKVTETPKVGSREIWQFVNLTVDAHPMHPHFIKHQVVARQRFNVGGYKTALCGSATCQPGTAPGGEMQVVPDVTPLLTGAATLVTAASVDGGWKDAVQAPPGMVTTIVADWTPRWNATGAPTAPGTAGCRLGTVGCAAPYVYEPVTSGPYVWHCHINSHEDSEMMRTSLVVP